EGGPAGHIRASNLGGVTLYVQVRDLAASIAKVVAPRGTLPRQPVEPPPGPTLAATNDPEGNPALPVQPSPAAPRPPAPPTARAAAGRGRWWRAPAPSNHRPAGGRSRRGPAAPS